MSQNKVLGIFILLVVLFGFDDYYQYSDYTPVVMKREALERSVFLKEAQPLLNPGKIYAKDNYLFINEKYEGIHVIDNTDPTNPNSIGFINVPGCIDMAIKGSILYADNAVDLVAIDLSKYPKIEVTERIKNIFPEQLPPDLDYIPDNYLPSNRPKKTIIIKWVKRSINN